MTMVMSSMRRDVTRLSSSCVLLLSKSIAACAAKRRSKRRAEKDGRNGGVEVKGEKEEEVPKGFSLPVRR